MNIDSFTDTTVVVVGGAGFVGSNLTVALLAEGVGRIVIADNLLSSDVANIPLDPRVEFLHGSVADQRTLNRLPDEIDFVFHLACFHGNQSSIADPIADHDNNTLTTLMLFDELSRRSGITKVVYAAAGCAVAEKTYDDAAATSEDAPVSLFHDSPYSISKLVGELYGNFYFLRHGLPVVKARFQNIYGPREILGAGSWRGTPHTVWRNVTPTFIWKALHGEALQLDNGGEVSRDFIFVEDLARGLIACALRGEAGEAYNLASGVETSIKDLAEIVNEVTDNTTPVDLRPARDWDRSGRRFGSTEKSERELAFKAEMGVREGIELTVEWTRANAALIERNMARHGYFLDERATLR